MVLERKLLKENLSDDLSPVMVRILNEIKDAMHELRGSMPESALIALAERKIALLSSEYGFASSDGGDAVGEDA
ncbi:hypothetical protein SAMN02927923_00960 [Microvirga guangxiensis]|uniref:Uncharacterized protein n=2 Tax=Microvirga guangxiensis TaxID=549386 RepID=A0A1G5EE62_9HYPH|nr:hypothetical protein SAMN02927923_00960 [Microvirga guangxiensis]